MRLLFIFLAIVGYVSVDANDLKAAFDYLDNPSNGPRPDSVIKISNCATEYKISDQMVGNMVKKEEFSLTEETKGFPICIAKSFGIMNEDGSLSKAFTDNSENDKCKNLGGKDQSEIAVKIIECIGKS